MSTLSGVAAAASSSADASSAPSSSSLSSLPYPIRPGAAPIYPGLASYMGMELTEDVIKANMPEYMQGGELANVVRGNLHV